MEIGLAVGAAFLFSAFNVLFDRLAPHGDLLNMFRKHKDHMENISTMPEDLQKQASNQFVSQWHDKLRDAVDSAEIFTEQVNYEALRLKLDGQHQNFAETSNQQVSDLNLCLGDEFFLNIKDKLEDTIETLEVLESKLAALP
ncbi:uncharacterized protein [Solanum lycopersicum]|uniref:uncharacterized protein isoform X4 n=1 Tax=Solanum lycopersicum TaxID=4081 RepID=UPI003748A779